MGAICDIIEQTDQLVTLPAVYLEVRRVLDDENSGVIDLVRALAQDAALSARLLQVANSAYLGYAGKVETVSRAVVLVGTHQIHDLVLATAVAQAFDGLSIPGLDVARYQQQSVYSGMVARGLAARCDVLDLERCFVEGLLRDIGHMVIYLVQPQAASQARKEAEIHGKTLIAAERRLLGCDYTEVGASLLQKWGVPESLQMAVRYQCRPDEAGDAALGASLLNIAGLVTAAFAANAEPITVLDGIADTAWRVTRLLQEDVIEVAREAYGEAQSMTRLVYQPTAAA